MRHDRDMTTAEALKAMQIIHKDSKDGESLERYVENRLNLYSMSKGFISNPSDETALRELVVLAKILRPDEITLHDVDDPYATMEGLNQPKDRDYVIGTVADFMVTELEGPLTAAPRNPDAAAGLYQHIEKITRAFDLEELTNSFAPEIQAHLVAGLDKLAQTNSPYVAFGSAAIRTRVLEAIEESGNAEAVVERAREINNDKTRMIVATDARNSRLVMIPGLQAE